VSEEPLREFEFIRWIRGHAATDERVLLGIGDDAAAVANRGPATLVTTDMLVDGVHFDLGEHAPRDVGWKALACSVSDIAAMGGRPSAAVVSAAAPSTFKTPQARELVEGILECGEAFDVRLVGGDLTGTEGPLAISVTLLGETGDLPAVTRGGAQVGDALLVTGQLGGSRRGRHLRFRPRHPEGWLLNQQFRPHAMIDISDGLAADLHHILEESGAGAEVWA
jgi:thiamine-monophosphate kinase